jgi:uridylate kinase
MFYKKILVKFSGESFGEKGGKIDQKKVRLIVEELKQLKKLKFSVAIVCGGGNARRGKEVKHGDRVAVDFKGMANTLKNSEYLEQQLKKNGIACRIYASFSIKSKHPNFYYPQVKKDWSEGKLLIFAGGTGYPFFSTDMSAVLFSLILKCDALIKATKVEGIYTADPQKFANASKIKKISYKDYIEKNLSVMDRTAVGLAAENRLPIRVLSWQPGNLVQLVKGWDLGSLIS